MPKIPELTISPEKVFFIIAKARQSESAAAGLEPEADNGDDRPEDRSARTDRAELAGFIRDLNEDEQIDLVTLMWLGRGDGQVANWRDLRAEATRAHNNRTASYLLGTPMMADYLEEALSEFGLSFEDFEEPL
jgi:Protein of unknown function (DUF3775)